MQTLEKRFKLCVSEGIQVFTGALSLVSGSIKEINELNIERKNYEYKTQIAINNAKNAKNEALRQQQLGIEEARKEKMSSLQDVSKQIAKNGASAFDIYSETNLYNYEDIETEGKINADDVQKNYQQKSLNYFNQANQYLNQAKTYETAYNNSLFKKGMNYLNDYSQVSQNWYQNKGGAI